MIKFKAVYSNPNDSWAIKKDYVRNIWASNEINATKLFKEVQENLSEETQAKIKDMLKTQSPEQVKQAIYLFFRS